MSRLGKKPIAIPAGVEVKVTGRTISVKGPKGELQREIVGPIEIKVEGGQVRASCSSEKKRDKAFHGLMRALIANMVTGVTQGFRKELDIQGVGYRAALQGKKLVLQLGFANPVEITPPPGILLEVPSQTRINVIGCDKQTVGQLAAVIRKKRPPEPYKGKGIRYVGEQVRKLAGKSFAAVE